MELKEFLIAYSEQEHANGSTNVSIEVDKLIEKVGEEDADDLACDFFDIIFKQRMEDK